MTFIVIMLVGACVLDLFVMPQHRAARARLRRKNSE